MSGPYNTFLPSMLNYKPSGPYNAPTPAMLGRQNRPNTIGYKSEENNNNLTEENVANLEEVNVNALVKQVPVGNKNSNNFKKSPLPIKRRKTLRRRRGGRRYHKTMRRSGGK